MNRYAIATAVTTLLAAAAVSACHTEEPKSPDVGLTKPLDPPVNPDLGRYPSTVSVEGAYSMWMTDSVRHYCAGPDPFFSFDATKPKPEDQPTMANLVKCMQTGPLAGKTIKLIGHTDPRGTADYNAKLGLERAEKVKSFLVSNGVDKSRVQTDSVGKDEAHAAPKEWGNDRRVEIELVGAQ